MFKRLLKKSRFFGLAFITTVSLIGNVHAIVPGSQNFDGQPQQTIKGALDSVRSQMRQIANMSAPGQLQNVNALLDPTNFDFKTKELLEVLARANMVVPFAIRFEAPPTVARGFFRLRQFNPDLQYAFQDETIITKLLSRSYLPRHYIANRLRTPVRAAAQEAPQLAVASALNQIPMPFPVQSATSPKEILNEISAAKQAIDDNTREAVQKQIASIKGVDFDKVKDRLVAKAGKITLPLAEPRIVVSKSKRRLDLFDGARLIKTYKVGTGQSAGDKVKQGDKKTPVGTYHLVNRNPSGKFHLFMGLNYPNAQDAIEGAQKKIISQETASNIVAAERSRRLPSWGTRLGGAVGIHGAGGGANWTAGCIALNNPDVEEIWLATKNWTPVEIRQ
jgi:lipoprotein-anchoring transpeptidase ErfK/SrfK